MIPIEQSGDVASVQNYDSSGDLEAAGEILTFDLLSDDPLPDLPDEPAFSIQSRFRVPIAGGQSHATAGRAEHEAEIGSTEQNGHFWFEGDALMCPCPDCQAPMAVRVWLMVADCWHCGTSIELSEEQEKQVRQMIERRQRLRQDAASNPAPARQQSQKRDTAAQPRRSPNAAPTSKSPPTRPRNEPARRQPERRPATAMPSRRRVQATGSAIGARARIRRMATAGSPSIWLTETLKMTPAWVISAVLHFIALLLLAFFTIPRDKEDAIRIVLSTKVSPVSKENDFKVEQQKDELEFNLRPPEDVNLDSEAVKQVWLKADQDARELQIDPDTPDPNLPPLEKVKQRIQTEKGPRRFVLARDPRVRVEMVKKEGGTTLTEAAVARGLRWLAKQQKKDGSWALQGGKQNDTAGTSLALLPFLGAGQTHMTGRYKDVVSSGLRWLINNQGEDGYLRDSRGRPAEMYAHGQGTIVLCEAYAMEGDQELRVAAQKAVDFIVEAQHVHGGWRYQPGQAGDTSVVGWQLMALQSARAAGLDVPQETLTLANQFLDRVWHPDGIRYGYQGTPVTNPRTKKRENRVANVSETMTAEAILCRMFLGWDKESPGVMPGIDWILENHFPNQSSKNMYFWYYATQTMHHAGGQQWRMWNDKMKDVLVNLQETKGKDAGSWSPSGFRWGSAGGRVFVTSLAICSLEVYYRHLPIFKQIDLD